MIKGKATVKTGTIASVRVTLNNKETWQDATLSEDGAFEFRFRPELKQKLCSIHRDNGYKRKDK